MAGQARSGTEGLGVFRYGMAGLVGLGKVVFGWVWIGMVRQARLG